MAFDVLFLLLTPHLHQRTSQTNLCPDHALAPACCVLLWSQGQLNWFWAELQGTNHTPDLLSYWTGFYFLLQQEKKWPSTNLKRVPLWLLIRACLLGPSMGELPWSRYCRRRKWMGASAKPCESSAPGLRMKFSSPGRFSSWSPSSRRLSRHGIKSFRRALCFIFALG